MDRPVRGKKRQEGSKAAVEEAQEGEGEPEAYHLRQRRG